MTELQTIKTNLKEQIKDLSNEEKINEIHKRRFLNAMNDNWTNYDSLYDSACYELLQELNAEYLGY